MRLLLSLAWRNSVSRRERSLLTILAVAIGVAMILGTNLTSTALRAQVQRAGQQLAGKADAEVFAFADTGFSSGMLAVVSGLPEVAVATPVVSKRLNGEVNHAPQAFQMLGVDPSPGADLHPFKLAAGQSLAADDAGAVLLDSAWAGQHGLHVGSDLVLFTSLGPDIFKVKGLIAGAAFIESSYGPVVVVPLTSAQHAFRLGAHITQVSVALKPGQTYEAFRSALRSSAIEEYSVRDNRAFVAAQRNPYSEIQPILVFFGLLALVIGLFLIFNNLAVTVIERRREIGLLRAAGATTGWVRGMFLAQAAMFGVVGSGLGCLLGLGVATLLEGYLASAADSSEPIGGIDPMLVFGTFLVGVAVTVVCGLIPAARAAGLAPLEAIRPQDLYRVERSRVVNSLVGAIAFLLGLLLVLPLLRSGPGPEGISNGQLAQVGLSIVLLLAGVLALVPVLIRPLTALVARPLRLLAPGETILARNAIVRRPNRSALTIAGLLVSSALVVAVAGLAQGSLGAGREWVDSLFVSDHLVVSPVHQDDNIRDAFRSLEGVQTVSAVSLFSLRAGDRALSMAAVDPVDYSARSKLQFLSGTRQDAFSELENGRGVIVSSRLAASRHLAFGDNLALAAGGAVKNYRVVAVVAHSFPSPAGDEASLISLANAHDDFGVSGFNILQVTARPGQAGSFADRLRAEAQRYGMQLESLDDVKAGVQRGIDSLLFMLTAVGLVGVILGLMSVVTTILLNIAESGREFALLRAVGITTGQVRQIVLTQAGMLGLAGALAGAVVGLGLTLVMVRAASTTGLSPAYTAPWSVILLVLLVALAGSAVAVVIPARRAARSSVVSALRYE